jgi:hypothetical protein
MPVVTGYAGAAAKDDPQTSGWGGDTTGGNNLDNVLGFTPNTALATIVGKSSTTGFLKVTGYGFAIPAGATINSLTVTQIHSLTTSGSADVLFNTIALTLNGTTRPGANQSDLVPWTVSNNQVNTQTASPTDWGIPTLTAEQINASTFGIHTDVEQVNGNSVRGVSIAYIKIEIDYTEPVLDVLFRWDGAAWVPTVLKRWNGSSWVVVEQTTIKAWSGSAWA